MGVSRSVFRVPSDGVITELAFWSPVRINLFKRWIKISDSSLARLAADTLLDVPPLLFWDDPDDDEDPYLSELSEFEQGVVLRDASTQALAVSQWPAAREELIYRLSRVSPDAPMPLEDMRQASTFFKPTDTEAKDLLARAIVIAAIAERESPLWIPVMEVGYTSRMVSYLEKNPDGLSESDVAWALEKVNGQSQLLLYANAYNFLLGSARLQYSA